MSTHAMSRNRCNKQESLDRSTSEMWEPEHRKYSHWKRGYDWQQLIGKARLQRFKVRAHFKLRCTGAQLVLSILPKTCNSSQLFLWNASSQGLILDVSVCF